MNENIQPNSLQAWLLAARPKTLTAASIPVMVGCALAEAHGHFQTVPAILCFLFAFLMQIDANFINDLYDFLKGSDREDRLGPERACAQGWISPQQMKRGILFTTFLAGICGLGLLFYSGWEMIPVGMACILLRICIPNWLTKAGETCWCWCFWLCACWLYLLRHGAYLEFARDRCVACLWLGN